MEKGIRQVLETVCATRITIWRGRWFRRDGRQDFYRPARIQESDFCFYLVDLVDELIIPVKSLLQWLTFAYQSVRLRHWDRREISGSFCSQYPELPVFPPSIPSISHLPVFQSRQASGCFLKGKNIGDNELWNNGTGRDGKGRERGREAKIQNTTQYVGNICSET